MGQITLGVDGYGHKWAWCEACNTQFGQIKSRYDVKCNCKGIKSPTSPPLKLESKYIEEMKNESSNLKHIVNISN